MSRLGLKVARLFGRKLPAFRNLADARSHLFAERDDRLAMLKRLAVKSDSFAADGSPGSLKKMEAWYFQLVESDGFRALGITREEFERCMATYFCHVVVTNCADAEWHVSEYAFEKGKFEIGVKCGLFELMRSSFAGHHAKPANRFRNAIYREYQRYFTT
jgi:hypothetical protein